MAYFPNGSAGAGFDEECDNCKYGQEPCPIASTHLVYNYDQVGNKLAEKILKILVKDNGTCNMKKLMDEHEKNQKKYGDIKYNI